MKKFILWLLNIKPDKKYIYVPDYRGRILYERIFLYPEAGISQDTENLNILATNKTKQKVEMVVYEYIDKSKKKKREEK